MNAFSALLISAQLAGAPANSPAAGTTVPAVSPEAAGEAAGVRPIGRAPLAGISAGRDRAAVRRTLGGRELGFTLALGPDGYLWVKVAAEKGFKIISIPALRRVVDAEIGGVFYRFRMKGDLIEAAAHSGETVRVSLRHMAESLYELGLHAAFGPVVYTMLYEDGAVLPEAAGLLRKDDAGDFWVTYAPPEGSGIHWFLAVDGTMFGLRLERPELAFYSQPVGAFTLGLRETPLFPPVEKKRRGG